MGISNRIVIVLILGHIVGILHYVNGLTFSSKERSFQRSPTTARSLRYPFNTRTTSSTATNRPGPSISKRIISSTRRYGVDKSNNNNADQESSKPSNGGLLDRIGLLFYNLEMDRVNQSSTYDEKGRYGEPMEWSEGKSIVNQFASFVSSNPIGYAIKQFIADTVAGSNYNRTAVQQYIQQSIESNDIVMFSFTTCPFCRRAKDLFEERGIPYVSIELDDAIMNNSTIDSSSSITGNQIRAELGRLTRRTSVPNIFIHQQSIGGCNDGTPGLVPLIESGQLESLLSNKR